MARKLLLLATLAVLCACTTEQVATSAASACRGNPQACTDRTANPLLRPPGM